MRSIPVASSGGLGCSLEKGEVGLICREGRTICLKGFGGWGWLILLTSTENVDPGFQWGSIPTMNQGMIQYHMITWWIPGKGEEFGCWEERQHLMPSVAAQLWCFPGKQRGLTVQSPETFYPFRQMAESPPPTFLYLQKEEEMGKQFRWALSKVIADVLITMKRSNSRSRSTFCSLLLYCVWQWHQLLPALCKMPSC